ncbi:MAG: L,D-transpeptidase [Pseudomonadota bacterium]
MFLGEQKLVLEGTSAAALEFPVSTARKGAGERLDSECTPRGSHRVRIRIGEGCPLNAVFVGRRFTGEIYSPELAAREPGRDWILTRVLWLTGLESGRNRGGDCDTLSRFIYLHGTPDSEPMGVPASHGCIRLRNRDMVRLFERVPAGTHVDILE